jgi:putative toxin-antitoxin system antitoxin component (TIGR02293 family)
MSPSSDKNQSKVSDIVVPYIVEKPVHWQQMLSQWLQKAASDSREDRVSEFPGVRDAEAVTREISEQGLKAAYNAEIELAMQSGVDRGLAELADIGVSPKFAEYLITEKLLSREEFYDIVIKQRTFSHRQINNQRLTSEETDRLLRLLRIKAYCSDFFGSLDKADTWLRQENDGFAGKKPISLVQTEAGARLVEQTLERIARGVVA